VRLITAGVVWVLSCHADEDSLISTSVASDDELVWSGLRVTLCCESWRRLRFVLWVLRVGLLAGPGVGPAIEVEDARVRVLLAGACVRTSVGASAVAGRAWSSAASSPLLSEALAWRLSWR
jgi:hypothetical protein